MSQTARNRMSGILNAALRSTRPCSPQPISARLRLSAPPPAGAERARYGAAISAAPSLAAVARKSRRVNPGSGGVGMVAGPSGLGAAVAPEREAVVAHEEERPDDQDDVDGQPGHALVLLHRHEPEREAHVQEPDDDQGQARLDAEEQERAEGQQQVAERVREVARGPERQEGGAGDALRHPLHVLVVVGKRVPAVALVLLESLEQRAQAEEQAEQQEGPRVLAARRRGGGGLGGGCGGIAHGGSGTGVTRRSRAGTAPSRTRWRTPGSSPSWRRSPTRSGG